MTMGQIGASVTGFSLPAVSCFDFDKFIQVDDADHINSGAVQILRT